MVKNHFGTSLVRIRVTRNSSDGCPMHDIRAYATLAIRGTQRLVPNRARVTPWNHANGCQTKASKYMLRPVLVIAYIPMVAS